MVVHPTFAEMILEPAAPGKIPILPYISESIGTSVINNIPKRPEELTRNLFYLSLYCSANSSCIAMTYNQYQEFFHFRILLII